MIRTFTQEELDRLCAIRPPEYREDVLKISKLLPDGKYEIDLDSEGYKLLRIKYTRQPPGLDTSHSHKPQYSGQPIDTYKAIKAEQIYNVAGELKQLLGAHSEFGIAYTEFQMAEKTGRCRGCARGRFLRTLLESFAATLYKVDQDTLLKARAMFPGTEYVTLSPQPLKWNDLISKK